jgi:hypothetical protein
MLKKLIGQVPTIVIAATTAAIFGGGGAYAAAQITSAQIADQTIQSRDIAAAGVGTSEVRDQSLVSGDIAENGVGTSEIRNGSITGADINDTTEKNLKGAKGDPGAPGAPGTDGADGVVEPIYSASAPKTVTNVGGSFGKAPDVRATELATVNLAAGKYVLTAEGFFINNQATTGDTRMQLAVRVQDGSNAGWGQDLGTCFTGAISTLANRESHCSSTRVVELDQAAEVKVYAFGYADDQGSADSGAVDAKSFVTVLPVQ